MIKKWKLDPGLTMVRLKPGTKVLHVDEQYGDLCVWTDNTWAEETARDLRYVFAVIATGSDSPPLATYVGTAKTVSVDGVIVMWHVFLLIDNDETAADRAEIARLMRRSADRTLMGSLEAST